MTDSRTTLASVISEMETFGTTLNIRNVPTDLAVQAIRDKFPEWLDKLKGLHLYEHGENKWARRVSP